MVKRLFPPLVNRILAFVQTHSLRGTYRLYRYIARNFPERVIQHKIKGRPFVVPADQWCFWLERGPARYYEEEFIPFCAAINKHVGDFVFFDLGADIGVVSSLIETHCARLKSVVAVEPNPSAYELLETNLNHFPVPTHVIQGAVSDFNGTADLLRDKNTLTDHEGRIERKEGGSVAVWRLDDLTEALDDCSWSDVVVKIDVEGEEIETIDGAARVLAEAPRALLLLEIHPEVLERTGATPESLFSAAEAIRKWTWLIPGCRNMVLNRERAFYDQVPVAQYDVIAVSV